MKKYVRTIWNSDNIYEVVKSSKFSTTIITGKTTVLNCKTKKIEYKYLTTKILNSTIIAESVSLPSLVDMFICVYADNCYITIEKNGKMPDNYEHLYGAIRTDKGLNFAIEYIDGEWRNLVNER